MYWLFICSTLFDIYEPRATGATYSSPDGLWTLKLAIIGFVDDTRNSTRAVCDFEDLLRISQNDCQLWNDILNTSNQALELPKCGYHIIHQDFKPSGEPVLQTAIEADITLKDSNGRDISMTQWPADKAVKYLGVYKCPDNQSQQAQVLQKQCDEFARVLCTSNLNRAETQTMYWAIFHPSVGYALPTCYFPQHQLTKIQRKAHRAMVSNSGFNRNTSSDVLFGPHYLGGAGFMHLYDVQGYGQVKLFLKFWRTPDSIPGKLLRITMAWAQKCAGISTPILQDPTTKLPHLPSQWLKSLRTYLSDTQSSITLQEAPIPTLQRDRDCFLMDLALTLGYRPGDLRRLNYCRLYLNVTLLSDITTVTGTTILHQAYIGELL